jgi:spermidine/putrescine transport system ATP-binding protein
LITSVDVEWASKVFGSGPAAVRALDEVSVAIAENEFFTLLGPSGCGKTTLLRLIGGFEQPTSGEIRLAGEAMGRRPPHQRPVNTVFQSYALFPHLSVAENIGFGLDMLQVPASEKAQRIDAMLALVKLDGMADRRPGQLSGGQQQRVALARALAPQPKVLLLDEPLSALDLKLRKEMQLELKRLQTDTGITFIFVTHDQEEALTMSDRIAVMADGRILQIGSPADIYERPLVRFVADFIGDTNFLDGEIGDDGQSVILPGGHGVALSVAAEPGRRVTAAVRPERVAIAGAAPDGLQATVETVVYFGTDTIHHLRLEQSLPFVVRVQNHDGFGKGFSPGDRVSLVIPPDAVRLLED